MKKKISKKISNFVNSFHQVLQKDFLPIETSVCLEVKSVTSNQMPCSIKATRSIIDFLMTLPHGVVRLMPHSETEVETSVSLSIINLHDDHLFSHLFARSSSEVHGKYLQKKLQCLARMTNVEVSNVIGYFPGWNPDMSSHALKIVKAGCLEVFKKPPKIYSVHAGLECGFLKGAYPNLDCVSFGPDIQGAHTPDERCHIASVDRFFKLLIYSLQHIADS